MRESLKSAARALAFVAVLPSLASYFVKSSFMGRDRALEGSTQFLALMPGISGQYLRQAFLAQTLAGCAPTATVSFGTIFSKAGARLDERVYVGAGCALGLVHIREQEGRAELVRIGAGSWIGSGAIVMADVGTNCVIGAGAVVTKPIPDAVVAAGVPAGVIRPRT